MNGNYGGPIQSGTQEPAGRATWWFLVRGVGLFSLAYLALAVLVMSLPLLIGGFVAAGVLWTAVSPTTAFPALAIWLGLALGVLGRRAVADQGGPAGPE